MKFLKNKRVKSIFLLVLLCSLLVGCDFNKNKDWHIAQSLFFIFVYYLMGKLFCIIIKVTLDKDDWCSLISTTRS